MQFPGIMFAARLDFAAHPSLLDNEKPLGHALGRIGDCLAPGIKRQLCASGQSFEVGWCHAIERRMAHKKFNHRSEDRAGGCGTGNRVVGGCVHVCSAHETECRSGRLVSTSLGNASPVNPSATQEGRRVSPNMMSIYLLRLYLLGHKAKRVHYRQHAGLVQAIKPQIVQEKHTLDFIWWKIGGFQALPS